MLQDLVLLTDSINNKTALKAKIVVPDGFSHVLDGTLNSAMTSISFVTDFDFSCCTFLHSGHLEQLAVACPNLQRLNLFVNDECLRSLKGLAKVAQCCANLCGLNLLCISLDEVEHPLYYGIYYAK